MRWRRQDQLALAIVIVVAVLALVARTVWWGWNGDGLRRYDDLPHQTNRLRFDLNAAKWPELATLPGIGELLAREIVAYREEHGPFHYVEDLTDVPGIGPGRLAALREFLFVGSTPE